MLRVATHGDRPACFAVEDRAYTTMNLVPSLLARFRHAHSLILCANFNGVPMGYLRYDQIVKASADQDIAPTSSNRDFIFWRDFFRRAMDQYAWNILALIHKDSTAPGGPGQRTGGRRAGAGSRIKTRSNYFEEKD